MSGILDSKTRVMDTILTQQGRKQLANGGLSIAYATFSDGNSFYSSDIVSGSTDASERLYLEVCSLPQDMITFEADDSGKLLPFTVSTGSVSPQYTLLAGQILSGSDGSEVTLTDSAFSSEASRFAESSLQNFRNLYVIGSRDSLLDRGEGDRFVLSSHETVFSVDDMNPVSDPNLHTANVSDMESFFNDPRFGRLPNFKFLPPLRVSPIITEKMKRRLKNESYLESKTNRHVGTKQIPAWAKMIKTMFGRQKTDIDKYPRHSFLGSYRPLGTTKTVTDEEILTDLKRFEKKGYRTDVEFAVRPIQNKVMCQIFEQQNGSLLKLDVLNFGSITLENGQLGDVYFVGKVVTDEVGVNTFLHIFTMVFESRSKVNFRNFSIAR
jgi:hypothetical protein